ncbi:family 16 glycosylhydrolase [Bacteroides fragilis]|nr:family 16 glycosylhydrolase [Bacteroides fragilis]
MNLISMGPLTPRSGIILPGGDVAHAYYYKPNDTSVVWCEDGMLNLKFMKDETDPRGYKSGSIRTDGGKFDFTYGKVEVKAKFSSGDGSWPAIWMMPASSKYGGMACKW